MSACSSTNIISFAMIDEPTLTSHITQSPQCPLGFHSWCCTIYGFDKCVIYHITQNSFTVLKTLCVWPSLFILPVPFIPRNYWAFCWPQSHSSAISRMSGVGIIGYVAFLDWLCHLVIHIQVSSCLFMVDSSFLFSIKWDFIVQMYHSLFLHSSKKGILVSFKHWQWWINTL